MAAVVGISGALAAVGSLGLVGFAAPSHARGRVAEAGGGGSVTGARG